MEKKYFCQLRNKPGKFVLIACIFSSHTWGKMYFFSAFANFLLKTLEMIIKKIVDNQLFIRYCLKSSKYYPPFTEMASLEKIFNLIHFHVLFIQMILWELRFLSAFLNSILFYQQNLFHISLKDQVSYVTPTGLVPTNPLSVNKRSTNLAKWLSVR